MYLCMSLGMQGRYRLSARGPAELDRVRAETFLVILRQRGAAEPALDLLLQRRGQGRARARGRGRGGR
ncbi:MAG TPA: DotU family type IV/VI secretion system protein [Acetobacteraceae bacterium]|nr:DotU family type IV/VI secretion system protein [Acetobacteraceae bacterium]